jgi:hypothetical protein
LYSTDEDLLFSFGKNKEQRASKPTSPGVIHMYAPITGIGRTPLFDKGGGGKLRAGIRHPAEKATPKRPLEKAMIG